MNFYKHHIGDYAKKTGALSMTEHGAYLLMLHAYYGTEKPLPFGRDLYRICRAFGKKERDAVDRVSEMFWTRTEAGFVNGRAFEEIEIANELADIARDNGSKGGRPKKPSGLISNNPAGLVQEPAAKAIQTPDSTIQSERESASAPPPRQKSKKSSRVPPDFIPDSSSALETLPDLDIEREVQKFRDWEFRTPRSDWAAVWRNWIETGRETGKYAKRTEAKIQWR